MRYSIVIGVMSVSLAAQSPPNCTGIGLEVDARCGCVRDPGSELCKMVKAGFYEPHDWNKPSPLLRGINGSGVLYRGAAGTTRSTSATTVTRLSAEPTGHLNARAQQARLVPLTHKDYLRFIDPNAQFAVGFDFGKLLSSPEIMNGLFSSEGDDRNKVAVALKEMDHMWLSFVAPNDLVVLMTGKFEQGAAAGLFYAQGIRPVFLGGAHAMMIGAEPSLQAALARLAKPAATGGWVLRRARELSQNHETWIANERAQVPNQATNSEAGSLPPIRRFALGFKLEGAGAIDGEVVAESEAGAEKIAAWIDRMKALLREKTGVGALDSLNVERSGASLKFAAKGDTLLDGDSAKAAMNSDFGVELYSAIAAGFPGMPARTVAQEKLLAVKIGMKREEVLNLVGRPLAVSAIQGLETPRETWIYQVPFGKQLSIRLDGGMVTSLAR